MGGWCRYWSTRRGQGEILYPIGRYGYIGLVPVGVTYRSHRKIKVRPLSTKKHGIPEESQTSSRVVVQSIFLNVCPPSLVPSLGSAQKIPGKNRKPYELVRHVFGRDAPIRNSHTGNCSMYIRNFVFRTLLSALAQLSERERVAWSCRLPVLEFPTPNARPLWGPPGSGWIRSALGLSTCPARLPIGHQPRGLGAIHWAKTGGRGNREGRAVEEFVQKRLSWGRFFIL